MNGAGGLEVKVAYKCKIFLDVTEHLMEINILHRSTCMNNFKSYLHNEGKRNMSDKGNI